VMRGRPSCLLQSARGEANRILLASALSSMRIICPNTVSRRDWIIAVSLGCFVSLRTSSDKKLSRYALSLPRRELKILVGLLTGHITLNTLNCYEDSRRSIMLSIWRTTRDFTPLFWGMLC